jgi:diguanylate cyclase (GGDEF)-like protein
LHAVNLELGNYVRLQPLLFSILERAMLMLGGHDGRLYLFREDRQELELATYIGGEPFPIIQLGEGASGGVALSGQPLLIEDYLTWEGRHGTALRWRSVVAVPLKRGSEILGTLTVVDIYESGRFGPLDLEALERFAALASLALEKAQLLENAQRAEAEAQARARELESLRAEAEHAARHDPLTGLKNRRAFEEDLHETLRQHLEGAAGFSLAVMDLSGFKAVNDSLGHAAGDEALQRIAAVLGERASDSVVPHTAYRTGGDEFLILIPEPINAPTLLRDIAQRVLSLEFDGGLHVMPNIGVASCPTDTDDMDRLQSLADKRMYTAKALGISMLGEEGENLVNTVARRRSSDR